MTKVEIRTELRNLKRLCRTSIGKQTLLFKKYSKLFDEALDDFEKYIMTEHFINDKTYYNIAIKLNSSYATVKRVVSDSLEKIKEYFKKSCN